MQSRQKLNRRLYDVVAAYSWPTYTAENYEAAGVHKALHEHHKLASRVALDAGNLDASRKHDVESKRHRSQMAQHMRSALDEDRGDKRHLRDKAYNHAIAKFGELGTSNFKPREAKQHLNGIYDRMRENKKKFDAGHFSAPAKNSSVPSPTPATDKSTAKASSHYMASHAHQTMADHHQNLSTRHQGMADAHKAAGHAVNPAPASQHQNMFAKAGNVFKKAIGNTASGASNFLKNTAGKGHAAVRSFIKNKLGH